MTITVTYTSIDRCRIRRKFKTLKGARAFAQNWVGEHPEIGCGNYAVSGDGIGKVTVQGAALTVLFPTGTDVAFVSHGYDDDDWYDEDHPVARYDDVPVAGPEDPSTDYLWQDHVELENEKAIQGKARWEADKRRYGFRDDEDIPY